MRQFIAAALAAGVALSAAPSHAEDQVRIGSTSASSSHYAYFVAVGKLINEQAADVQATVIETGATLDNLRRIQRGQVELGLVTTNVVQHAYSGTKDFDGKPVDVRLLWVYTEAPQNVVVRADSGVEDLAGLEGQRFNPGIKGSATERTTEAVFSALGVKPDYVRGSTTDVVNMIKDNRVVGYAKSGARKTLDASTLDIATFTPIKVLSLTDAQKATLREKTPDISVVDIPEGVGEGIPAYSTWSFGVGVGASPELSEEAAYKIVSAVMADKTVQANAMAAMKGADIAKLTLDYGNIPLHPGAARWFEEHGFEIPDAMKPTE